MVPKWPGKGKRTIHEVRKVNKEVTSLSIMVCEDTIVNELPAEGIWNVNDNANGGDAFWGIGDICWEAMDVFHSTGRAA